MSSYWAELPLKIDSSSEVLKLPKSLTKLVITFTGAQIFGILLNSIGIDFSKAISEPYTVIVTPIVNYLIFIIVLKTTGHFDFVPLPSIADKKNERFVKTIILPSSAVVISFAYGVVLMLLIEYFPTVFSFNWVSYFYAIGVNFVYGLFIDQFSRISYIATGRPTKHSSLFKLTSLVLFIVLITLLSAYYLKIISF